MFSQRNQRMNRRGLGGNVIVPLDPLNAFGSRVVLWLRSDQGITLDTGVSQWSDLSGNANHFTQAVGAVQPVYSASDANLNGAPSVTFSPSASNLICLNSISIRYFLAVSTYPGTVFSGLSTLFTKGAAGGDFLLRGNGGAADWRTIDDAPGQRFRDNVLTDIALDVANKSHAFAKQTNSLLTSSTWVFGVDPGTPATREWKGSVAELFALNAIPDQSKVLQVLAYMRARYLTP